jgi:hypothetical protein
MLKTTPIHTQRSFSLCIIVIAVMLFVAVLGVFEVPPIMLIIGFCFACISGVAGFVFGLKSLSEPNSFKKISALLFSGFFVLLLLAFLLGDWLGN